MKKPVLSLLVAMLVLTVVGMCLHSNHGSPTQQAMSEALVHAPHFDPPPPPRKPLT